LHFGEKGVLTQMFASGDTFKHTYQQADKKVVITLKLSDGTYCWNGLISDDGKKIIITVPNGKQFTWIPAE
jgi:hypothetical protein